MVRKNTTHLQCFYAWNVGAQLYLPKHKTSTLILVSHYTLGSEENTIQK